jgi:DNA integrity scanning protein DisA with diadenylate cyclase activity
MTYHKINVELVVFAEESAAVVAELNSAIDRLEDTYAIFGGDIEAIPVKHSGTRRKSALRHTLEAGNAVTSTLKSAAQNVVDAYKKVI